MALAVVAVIDLAYLSYAAALGWLVPASVPAGAVGLALFAGLNTACLVRPTAGDRLWAALAPTIRRVDALLARAGARAILGALVALALLVRLRVLHREPVDPGVADMLPLLQQAMARVLAGADPYVWYHLPYPVPMTYLPALWLPMVPAFWLGADVRLVQVLATCGAGAVIGSAAWGGAPRLGASPSVRLVLAGALLLSPATVAFAAMGHTGTYWFYLAVLLAALAGGRWFVAGVAAGLCVLARQTMWAALPVVLIHVARATSRRDLGRFLLGGLIPVVALGPLIARDPVFVLWGSLRWYSTFGPIAYAVRRWWVVGNPGFASVLYPLGVPGLLSPIGIACLALVLVYAWRGVTDVGTAMRSIALALLAVTLAAPTPWRYEFVPIVQVVIGAALVSAAPSGPALERA